MVFAGVSEGGTRTGETVMTRFIGIYRVWNHVYGLGVHVGKERGDWPVLIVTFWHWGLFIGPHYK